MTLALKTYRADQNSFHVGSVLLTGVSDAVLIDAQFTLADAHRVVADVLAARKRLTTVYLSHGDPDYYFGLEVIRAAFPAADIVATAATVEHILKTAHKKLAVWGPKLGGNGPRNVLLPNALPAGQPLELEGEKLEILQLDPASPDRTCVWVPSLSAVVGGVVVYGNLHLWTADAATKEKRVAWAAILDGLLARRPALVVPGHAQAGAPEDARALEFSRDYLRVFEEELAKAKDGAQLAAAMKARYPAAGLAIAIDIGAKVCKGEMQW